MAGSLSKSVYLKIVTSDEEAQAKLDAISAKADELAAKNPDLKVRIDTAAATAKLAVLREELKAVGKDSGGMAGEAESSMSSLAQAVQEAGSKINPGMVTPMAALVAAGVALSPVLVTVASGLGGLGLAAYGVISPIMKAAQAQGGLAANLAKLDPLQRQAARSILALQGDYHQFQASLKPVIIGDMNAAIAAARPLMAGLQPVAQATGAALEGVFHQVGAMFSSPQWQGFFQFMARNAGPDIQLLGTDIVQLTASLPGLLEALQPVAKAFLDGTTAVLGFVHGISSVINLAQEGAARISEQNATMGKWASGVNQASLAVTTLGGWEIPKLWHAFGHLDPQTSSSTSKLGALAKTTQSEAQAAQQAATALNNQTQAFIKGLAPLNNYVNATLAQRNDLKALETALKASGDAIGYNTQQQRTSFSAAQTYISDLENTAAQALQSGTGVKRQADQIRNALPILESVSGKTGAYNTELARLRDLLDQLRRMPDITKTVNVFTNYSTSRGSYISGGAGGHRLASGGTVTWPGMTLVGEQGPELAALPVGTRVFPAGQTAAMLGGSQGPLQMVVSWGGGTSDPLIQELVRQLRFEVRAYGGGSVQGYLGWGSS